MCCMCLINLEVPYIKHNGFWYCDYECFNEGVKDELFYAWLKFKNTTDIYNGEMMLGAGTLRKEHR